MVMYFALVFVFFIAMWFLNNKNYYPCQVLYKDGKKSVVMPKYLCEDYAKIFGGKVISASLDKEQQTNRWKRGIL